MRKQFYLIVLICLVAVSSFGQRVRAYQETSSDTLKVETWFMLDEYSVKLSGENLVIKATIIDSVFAYSDNTKEFVSTKSKTDKVRFRASDTLFKFKWTSDTTYIIKDTTDVRSVYNRPLSNKVANLYRDLVKGYQFK